MNDQQKPISINSSSIAVAGVGGLGMIALVVIIAATFPVARGLVVGGIVGGVCLAAILILRRRRQQLGGPRSDLPIVLFSMAVQRHDAKAGTGEEDPGYLGGESRTHSQKLERAIQDHLPASLRDLVPERARRWHHVNVQYSTGADGGR